MARSRSCASRTATSSPSCSSATSATSRTSARSRHTRVSLSQSPLAASSRRPLPRPVSTSRRPSTTSSVKSVVVVPTRSPLVASPRMLPRRRVDAPSCNPPTDTSSSSFSTLFSFVFYFLPIPPKSTTHHVLLPIPPSSKSKSQQYQTQSSLCACSSLLLNAKFSRPCLPLQ